VTTSTRCTCRCRSPCTPSGRSGHCRQYRLGDPTDPDNDDAYRIELENASRVIASGAAPVFGRADAVDQAAAIEAVRTAAAAGTTVTLDPPTLPPLRRPRAGEGL
jgi:predicted dehydrogenase